MCFHCSSVSLLTDMEVVPAGSLQHRGSTLRRVLGSCASEKLFSDFFFIMH